MNPISDIIRELEVLSPILASAPRTNIYKVPEGYFNQFSNSILDLIKEDVPVSFSYPGSQGMSVPEGYFSGLADSIISRIRQESESPAAEIARISPAVSSIGNDNIFKVPIDYFENLIETVTANIKNEYVESVPDEISRISGAIAAIGNQNVYSVPEGYFESLDFLISQKIPVQAKVVEMPRRKSIIRYMAAAVITGLIGISVFSVFNNKAGEITATPDATVMAEANKIINSNSFEQELASISGQDIEAYLKENGQDVNAALVASVTDDENALPGSEEYLINENTLDEFLNKMNLNN